MIKRPPARDNIPHLPYSYLQANYPDKLDEYMAFYRAVDEKGRYLPFDEYRHRIPKGMDVNLVWALIKSARSGGKQSLFYLDEFETSCQYLPTNSIQKATSVVDQNATTSALEWTTKKIGEEDHSRYFLNDLIEDESISSSQLEGAVTTTLVAKDMLKRKREPRSIDEKMILGNFNMMRFVWDNRDASLTPEFIKELHFVGVSGIDDEKYRPGLFRDSDDVVVEDADGNIVHQSPPANNLVLRLAYFCAWVDRDHDDHESNNYIHPLIKAICIHFAIGYEHPFRDGNGRIARALFYWFMFKRNYGAFRYISISNLLKNSVVKYGKSYLYTETDDMDLTYFIEYQSLIVMRAVLTFKSHCQKIIADIESFNRWLWESGIYSKLTDKQKTVFQVAKSNLAKSFTVSNVKDNLGCSYNTAASVLNGLVDLHLFEKNKDGKEWIYSLRDKQEIQKNWNFGE